MAETKPVMFERDGKPWTLVGRRLTWSMGPFETREATAADIVEALRQNPEVLAEVAEECGLVAGGSVSVPSTINATPAAVDVEAARKALLKAARFAELTKQSGLAGLLYGVASTLADDA